MLVTGDPTETPERGSESGALSGKIRRRRKRKKEIGLNFKTVTFDWCRLKFAGCKKQLPYIFARYRM